MAATDLDRLARSLQLRPVPSDAAEAQRRRAEGMLGSALPTAAAGFLRYPGLLGRLVRAYDAHAIFPRAVELVDPSLQPDDTKLLLLALENQGVCAWGLPLAMGDDPPVVVAGATAAGGRSALTYAPDVARFAAAWLWDRTALRRELLAQAQARPSDAVALAWLRAHLRELPATWGWPAREHLRFEGGAGVTIALWNGARQCDWWISADDERALADAIAALRHLSDLEESLWANTERAIEVLRRLGIPRPGRPVGKRP